MVVENLKKTTNETTMAAQIEVNTQTESTESSNNVKSVGNNDEISDKTEHKNDERCRKCMDTCSACTEKDKNLRSRNIEFTKIEDVFKVKCT
ncbi:hypothetical protein Hanom_Chr08g00731011 [Helianthus anomalus]